MDQVRMKRQSLKAPVVSWVPVTDSTGRVRMEMRWLVDAERLVARASRPRGAAA
jgi:hypothetical protein